MAALAVVWGHALLAFAPSYLHKLSGTPLQLFVDGYGAVSMFFVLSGYVLSFRYLSLERMQAFELWGFYLKRYCRIALPYLGALVLSLLAFRFIYDGEQARQAGYSAWALRLWSPEKVDLGLLEYIKSVIMILPGTQFPLIPQAWTLRIEMGMSLLLPFLILVACRSPIWLAVLAVVLVKLLNLYIYIAHFVFGILLAIYAEQVAGYLRRHTWTGWLVLLLGLLLFGYKNPPDILSAKLTPAETRLLTGLGSAMVLGWIMANPLAQKFLGIAVFRFLGRVSYSLYLVHLVVILAIMPLLINWWAGLGLVGHGSNLLALILTTALSLLLASACWYLMESPSMKLGYHLSSALRKRHNPLSTTG
jgi:peptidoglycan/LPS O-acetylase OafA/YrhL